MIRINSDEIIIDALFRFFIFVFINCDIIYEIAGISIIIILLLFSQNIVIVCIKIIKRMIKFL